MQIAKDYVNIKTIKEKNQFIEQLGVKVFLFQLFSNTSRTIVPTIMLDSLNSWQNLTIQDWNQIMVKLKDNHVAILNVFIPFMWQFLRIDFLAVLLESDEFSKELKIIAKEKYFYKKRIKEQWLKSFLGFRGDQSYRVKELNIIQDKLMHQGAKGLPETIKVPKPQRVENKFSLSVVIKEIKVIVPSLYQEMFYDNIFTLEKLRKLILSMKHLEREKLLNKFPELRNFLNLD